MTRRVILFSVLALIVIGLIVWVVWYPPFGDRRDEPLRVLRCAVPPPARLIFDVARINHKTYRNNSGWWSLTYFGCTFGAALLSALSGIILKLDVLEKNHAVLRRDLAAIFAGVAALLITLSTIGDFEAKWRANRLAASATEELLYKLATPDVDPKGALAELRTINHMQDQAIVTSRGAASR
jgi:hypothetical protein